MGVIYDTISLRSVFNGSDPIDLLVKVDTGASMLVLPGWVQEQFQFPVVRTQEVRHANEETAELNVVYGVEVTVCNRKGVFEAVIKPSKKYGLLGGVVMESLDLIAEPRSQKVYPNPRSPDLPMAEIE